MSDKIPIEHQMECTTCGIIIDLRDLGQVLSHGIWDDVNKRYYCEQNPIEVEYQTSRKVGDSTEWTKDKKPINLN